MEFTNLISEVYRNMEGKISKRVIEDVIRETFDEIQYRLETNDFVSIPKFGRFKSVLRSPRKGFNPKTKKSIDVPAQVVPVFKPYDSLRISVRTKAPKYFKRVKK